MILLTKILTVLSVLFVALAIVDYVRVSNNIRKKKLQQRKERYEKWGF